MGIDEILKSQGLNEEQIANIKNAMNEGKIFFSSEPNLDIRYNKLKDDHDALTAQYGEAQKLIEAAKKSEGTNQELQGKIGSYEQRIAELEQEKQRVEVDAAIKLALVEAGAEDVDYLAFKLRANEEEIKLDKDGRIKGIEETVKTLKTQFPAQFKGATDKKIEENRLEHGEDKPGITAEQFKKMGYQERNRLFHDDPDTYKQLTQNGE